MNPRPLRILYVHSSDELYGSDIVLYELVRRLDRERFQPLVVVPTDLPYRGDLRNALAQANVPARRVNMAVLRRRYLQPRLFPSFLWRLAYGTWALTRLIRQERIDLVHSNTAAVWCGALAARLTRRPHVWHIHEIIRRPTWLRRGIARAAVALSDRVVAISGAVRDHLLADAPDRDGWIVVIPDAVDTERFRPDVDGSALRRAWGCDPNTVLIGQVGRIHTWKGQEVFARAAALLRDRYPQARFVVVGDIVPGQPEPLDRLKARIAEAHLNERFTLAGYRRDAPQVMAALDVLVQPSAEPEPFGMVVIEAMASGKPVVATAHGGPLEIVVDGETGFLVPPGDPAALAEALARLIENPSLRRRMGAAGRERAVTRYGFPAHVAAFAALYEALA